MTRRLVPIVLLAACHSPHGGTIGNSSSQGALDPRAFALLPPKGDGKVLDKLEVTPTPDEAAAALAAVGEDQRGNVEEGQRPHYYDLDGDKRFDLYFFPQVYFGPSEGYEVYLRDGKGLRRAFGDPGDWVIVDDGDRLLMSYETIIIDESFESIYRRAFVYSRRDHAWTVLPVSFRAIQRVEPPAATMVRAFHAPGATTLRATPKVDDAPVTSQEEGMEPPKVTLRGNVLADYAPGAKGLALATQGEWTFVAFDPAVRPTATSMQHGMAETDVEMPEDIDSPAYKQWEHSLRSPAWLVGWVQTSTIALD